MQWIRTNRRFGAWCAFVAIALQIVLSFGHTHRIDSLRPGGLFPAAAAVHAGAEHDPAPKPAGLAAEYCAICAVIEMVASPVPLEAAGAGVPVMTVRARFAAPHTEAAWTLGHLLFQARAPPSA
jgi:hypothetical protein